MNAIQDNATRLTLLVMLAGSGMLAGEDRTQIPPRARQNTAKKVVKRRYQAEYKYASRSATAKIALARSLIRDARKKDDDPVQRFVLLREARDLAAKAGSAALALEAVNELISHYEVDELDEKTSVIRVVKKNARPEQYPELALGCLSLSAHFVSPGHVANDEFLEAAENLCDIAEASARGAKKSLLVKQVLRLKKAVRNLKKEHRRYVKALKTLTRAPKNSNANLRVGRYLSLFAGDLKKALPHFELSSSQVLRSVAEGERRRPRETQDRMELGDDWWALATSTQAFKEDRKDYPYQWYFLVRRFHLRAAVWYKMAVPKLKGIPQIGLKERIAIAKETRTTESLGGEGGTPFKVQPKDRGLLVGLRFCQSPESSRLCYLQPLFRHQNSLVAGAGFGRRTADVQEVLAPPGYAIGALAVGASSTRVHGLRVVFMKVDGVRLDERGQIYSSWLGTADGAKETRLLGGGGKFVVGIVGQFGAHIDALGLVVSH